MVDPLLPVKTTYDLEELQRGVIAALQTVYDPDNPRQYL